MAFKLQSLLVFHSCVELHEEMQSEDMKGRDNLGDWAEMGGQN
jgi:hypothetical protein